MTSGLEVLVQEVIAAITTAPWSSSASWPESSVRRTGLRGRSGESPAAPDAAGRSPSWSPVTTSESEAGKDSAPLSSSPTGAVSHPV